MAENEFVIDTTLDTRDAENNAEHLNKKIQNMTKDIENMSDKQKNALQKSANAYNKTSRAVEEQKEKIRQLNIQLSEMRSNQEPTDEFVEIGKQIDNAQAKLDKLLEAQEKFTSNGGKTSSRAYKSRQSDIEQLTKTIEYAKAEQEELLKSGGAYKSIDTSSIESQIATAETKLNDLQNDLNAKGVDLNLKLDSIEPQESKLKKFFSGIGTLALSTGNKIKSIFGKAFSAIGSLSLKAFNGIKSSISKVVSAIKNPKSLAQPFEKGFKKVIQYGLGVRSLFFLINKLRSALMEGVKNLANFNNGTNKVNQDMTLLKSSLTQLKNSFASAFAPIISYVTPILAKLSAMLSEIVTKIGMVLAKLGGASTFIKAKKVVDNYADSVSNANKQLASFDELNNVSSSDSDSGLSANDMFEEVPIDDSTNNLAEKLKQAWENADFTEIGLDLGQKLLDALNNIPWSEIQAKAGQIGKSLATLLNGVFKTDGLGYEIGNTIAQSINTGLTFANEFLKNFDFASFGTFIGDGINGALLNIDWNMMGENFALKWNGFFTTILNAVKTIKWSEIASSMASGINTAISTIDAKTIGESIGETFKGAFKYISTAIQEIHWYELGTKIDECIRSVDWNGVADGLFETLGSALGGLASFLWGIIEQAMTDLATWWYDNAFENGQFSITGLLDGIVEALVDIGTWIYDHIFTPFINGFKKAFKINSPSKIMSEQGDFIVQGLYNGIKDKIDTVTEIWTNFKDTVIGIFEELWNGIKNVINSILSGVEAMANGIVNGINKIIDVLNNLEVHVPDWVPLFGGKSIGFNIGHMDEISLPRLANGTVVPRQSSEFMAVMGDNNKETEVVSPLSTMVEAFNKANNNGESVEVLKEILTVLINKETGITDKQIFNSVQKSAREYTMTTGRFAF